MLELKKNLYYVGTQNPALRIFDIIMNTEFGTTYNAYIIKGEKTALIETSHPKFYDVFKASIEEVCPISEIDYVIFNHTEPDHSGVFEKLLEENPNLKAFGTTAAIRFVKAISNKEFDSQVVKPGEKLDLGEGVELEFIPAPNLHWADSMFTYCEALKTVFTCDFLGCHYCEPTITDDFISEPDGYWRAFEYYYTAIMGPFKKFTLDGLAKLEKLDFDMIAPSHGPVLKHSIAQAMAKYKEWAQPTLKENTAAIFYISAYGYTDAMAKALAEGLKDAGVEASVYDIIKTDPAEIAEKIETSAMYMFGSPTINRDAVKPIWDVLSMIDPISNKGKKALLFGSYGWSGEACKNMQARVEGIGLKVPCENQRINFKPTQDDVAKLKEVAKQFAEA